jgi:hypothetical protein
MQKRAGDKAANAASYQAQQDRELQREMYEREWSASEPWRASARNALRERELWMKNPELSPMTRLYMNEGRGALNRSLASKGLLNSGAAVEAESGMNQNYLASDKAARIAALNQMSQYTPPGGGASYSAGIGQTGERMGNALLMSGANRGSMYQSGANMLQGGVQDYLKYRGYGGGGNGGGGGYYNYNDMNAMA